MAYDLESLRLAWWVVLGLVLIGLAVSEGISIGVTLLFPMLAKTESERATLAKVIAPTCIANLAWLIVFTVTLFSAWPIAYAISMASFYPALLLVLLALLLRPIALYFFDNVEHALWQQHRHKVVAASGALPAVLFGLVIGNVIKGIPFHLESDMQIRFLGDFGGLFNLFSMLVALTCMALLAMHGAVFVQLRSSAELQLQAKAMVIRASMLFLILFAASGLWITHLEGYHVSSEILPNAVSNPLAKFVKRGEGLWLDNYEHIPALWLIPALAFLGVFAVFLLAKRDKTYWAMLASSLSVTMVVLTFAISMFPFLLPSNISLNSSLTIWDSSASQITLQVLLGIVIFALPLMALLSRWTFCLQVDQTKIAESTD